MDIATMTITSTVLNLIIIHNILKLPKAGIKETIRHSQENKSKVNKNYHVVRNAGALKLKGKRNWSPRLKDCGEALS